MPPAQDASSSAPIATLRQSSSTYSQSLTPPPDHILYRQQISPERNIRSSPIEMLGNDDNTAAGMALSQEDSMYITPAASPIIETSEERKADDHIGEEHITDEDMFKSSCQSTNSNTDLSSQNHPPTEHEPSSNNVSGMPLITELTAPMHSEGGPVELHPGPGIAPDSAPSTPKAKTPPRFDSLPKGLAKVDLELCRDSDTAAWDISDRRPVSRSPSSLFQPYAKYIGTQQSDRQTYNVEVTILTVDMDQCSLSGYLLIRGLTPEHPLLQTFFTGEIVGGPNQRHGFKTMDPAWGANDKVDLQHWLRFPSWRHLSSHAKRDMNFDFPLDDQQWYTQEHVFMRWKEHFLVPDYKQSNIQGASFEGFYYICLNQIEGKISGVYFHSKSEKYQQLELTHANKRGVWAPGVLPLVEFR